MSKRKELQQAEKESRKRKKLDYDPYLLECVQPQGGITFRDEKNILTGGGMRPASISMSFPGT